jgi:hypothetical protein
MAFSFWDKKEPAAPVVSQVKSSARPGVGSDPAPYLPDNMRNWADEPHEAKARQDRRLNQNPRNVAWRLGVPEVVELAQLRQTTDVLYAAPITDDNHTERKYVQNPYIVNPPQPKRRRLIQSTFRQTADSVQRFGAHNQQNGPRVNSSMATQRRTYSIGGMTPVIGRRNTYRLEPPPVDLNRTDLPSSGTRFDVADATTVSRDGGTPLRGVRMLR